MPDSIHGAKPGADPVGLADPRLFRQQAYIDGCWHDADAHDADAHDADAHATLTVTDPADGAPLGTAPKMGVAETRRAIEAANRAWPDWRYRSWYAALLQAG